MSLKALTNWMIMREWRGVPLMYSLPFTELASRVSVLLVGGSLLIYRIVELFLEICVERVM